MDLKSYILLYLLTLPVFFIVDIIWLGYIAKSFYRFHLRNFLSSDVNWVAAMIFYLIYIAGIIFFAVRPALAVNSWHKAIFHGGLYGFFTYATYDLTNMATLKNWPLQIVIVDILWGMFLCSIVATASYRIAIWLL